MMSVLYLFQELEGQHFNSVGGGVGLEKNSLQKQSVNAGRRETTEKVERKLPHSLRSLPRGYNTAGGPIFR